MSYQLLSENILQPLSPILGQRVTACFYHDVVGIEALTTNEHGIDIIAQQVELVFENRQTIFIGWNGVKGWPSYTISVSATSFCMSSERFRPETAFWQQLMGQRLTSFDVFGFPKTRPHLLLIYFEETEVAIGNCYLEFNFIPKDVLGDDVWILSNSESIQLFIKKLGLEKLEA